MVQIGTICPKDKHQHIGAVVLLLSKADVAGLIPFPATLALFFHCFLHS
jgi:hypothetical protein